MNVNVAYGVLIFSFLVNISLNTCIAQTIFGRVIEPGGKPLAFATIQFGDTNEGVVANLDGIFSFNPQVKSIEVSHTNYTTRKVEILPGKQELVITLYPSPANLEPVVVVKNTGNKLRRILNNAIANRNRHNPDKYDWYQCNVYYKMILDIHEPADTKDTTEQTESTHDSLQPYVMITETYSKRTWQKPAKLQEQVIASRLSGFTKPMFSTLITDVLPFHTYDDFINLNGKDFFNPISKGLYDRFRFKLNNEIVQQVDTIWAIDFQPKTDPGELAGTVYITSNGFAITHLIAHSRDTASKKDLGIEQQYARYNNRWFPQQLNYTLQWQLSAEDSVTVSVKGTSVIDSVSFDEDRNFRFDKAHTVQLAADGDNRRDSIWLKLRPVELDERERLTYSFMDSVFKKNKVEKLALYSAKLIEGKFPAGKFDVNLNRIYTYNAFEENRVGWGMQTSEQVSKAFSMGGWAGYGTRDKQWKYGAFAEVYADRYKEFVISTSYYNDIRDPGRLQIHEEIDNNTLRSFLITRADKVEGWNVSVKKKVGYLTVEAVVGKEKIRPQYNYAFNINRTIYQSFNIDEASLNLRYAFGETSSPFFGRYYPIVTKYPVFYGRIITGRITNANINYTQTIAAVSWRKNINRLGNERFLLSAGISLSKQPLPLSKLFAGNGFYDENISLYTFGGMETMLPYQFYSERFVNFYWLHQFNRSLFRAELSRRLTVAPKPAIAYNILYGGLKDASVHHHVFFSVAHQGYQEGGLMLNNILRLKILGLYHATFNAGYFHNIPHAPTYENQGRLVYGIGVEL